MGNSSRRAAAILGLIVGLVLLPQFAQAQALPPAEPEAVGLSSQRLERLSRFLRNEIAEGKIPGAVMLVARHGKLAYLQAFGLRDQAVGADMQTDSLFRLASMTKPITIVAAMGLIEEGRMRLNTPIAQFLPQSSDMKVAIEHPNAGSGGENIELVPANRPILIVDLLRHTSGFTYEDQGEGWVKQLYRKAGIGGLAESAAERVDKLAKMPLVHQPGTVWEYGRSVDVLGRIIEQISGQRLGEFVKERVLTPLRLTDTAYFVAADKRERITVLGPAPAGTPARALRDITVPLRSETGGEGLIASTGDYARFLQMLLNGGVLEGARVLSRKSVEMMTTNELDDDVIARGPSYFPGPGYGYGFGFAVRTKQGLAPELGSIGDYHVEGLLNSFAFVDPKEQIVAVLMVQAYKWLYYRPMIKDLVLQSIID